MYSGIHTLLDLNLPFFPFTPGPCPCPHPNPPHGWTFSKVKAFGSNGMPLGSTPINLLKLLAKNVFKRNVLSLVKIIHNIKLHPVVNVVVVVVVVVVVDVDVDVDVVSGALCVFHVCFWRYWYPDPTYPFLWTFSVTTYNLYTYKLHIETSQLKFSPHWNPWAKHATTGSICLATILKRASAEVELQMIWKR